MKVRLEITKGLRKDRGRVFEIARLEPDNITVGRSLEESGEMADKTPDAVTRLQGQPHLQISAGDLRLSRWHFMLLIRPPNCFVVDLGSANHTYLNDFNKGRHIRDKQTVATGDLLQVGRTCLRIELSEETPEIDPACKCARCGRELPEPAGKSAQQPGAGDLICSACAGQDSQQHAWVRASQDGGKNKWPFGVFGRGDRGDDEQPRTATEKPLAGDHRPAPEASPQSSARRCANCRKVLKKRFPPGDAPEDATDPAAYLCKRCAQSAKEMNQRAGDYLLLKKVGEGGMGVVYKAWHKRSCRVVAVKELLPDKLMDARTLKVFHREISVTRDLVHPHIVRFFDSFTHRGRPYLATEFLPGGNAEEMLMANNAPFSTEKAGAIVLDTLEGLAYAHQNGFVHRDVKPNNILFDHRGRAKLADMGFAKSFDLAGQSGITTDEIGGTPFYMAPEQILDYRFVRPSADVYSVGVCFYYLVTGKFHHDFPSPLDRVRGWGGQGRNEHPFDLILNEQHIPIKQRLPGLPPPLADVVEKCLQGRARDRFQDAGELKAAMEKALA